MRRAVILTCSALLVAAATLRIITAMSSLSEAEKLPEAWAAEAESTIAARCAVVSLLGAREIALSPDSAKKQGIGEHAATNALVWTTRAEALGLTESDVIAQAPNLRMDAPTWKAATKYCIVHGRRLREAMPAEAQNALPEQARQAYAQVQREARPINP